jgi:hypothetical protein
LELQIASTNGQLGNNLKSESKKSGSFQGLVEERPAHQFPSKHKHQLELGDNFIALKP